MGIAVSHSTHIFFHISALSAQSWLSEIERCEQIRSQPTISAPFLLVCPSVSLSVLELQIIIWSVEYKPTLCQVSTL